MTEAKYITIKNQRIKPFFLTEKNTQSFTKEKVNMMSKELNEKFKLDCEVRSNKGKIDNSYSKP